MYKTLSGKILLTIVIIIALIVILLRIAFNPEITALNFTEVAFSSIGFITILLGIIAKTSWWRCLWLKFPILNDWIFPDLNGEWTGNVKSNWPIKEAMMEAAKSSDKNFNIDKVNLDDMTNLTPVDIFIKQDWLKIEIELKSKSGYSGSNTIYVNTSRKNNKARLSYVFENDTPEPLSSDQPFHLGAATLYFSKDEDNNFILDGDYWTNRGWRKGLNTAGRLSLNLKDRKNPTKFDCFIVPVIFLVIFLIILYKHLFN